MTRSGTPIAIVGAGPAGFFAAEALLKGEAAVAIDIINGLPAPFGLVRDGVAPDHQAIKSVARVYQKILARDEVRYFGNVTLGRDVTVDDLRSRYDQIVYAVGAQSDRRLNIPGEDLERSHPALRFVAWYNGHPGFRDAEFDLGCEDVVVIGNGNVAIDVARILVLSLDRLATTDIADHALAALRKSRVKRVTLLGRRGPVQASFTNPELREFGRLDGVCAEVDASELDVDAASRAALEGNAVKVRNMNTLRGYAGGGGAGAAAGVGDTGAGDAGTAAAGAGAVAGSAQEDASRDGDRVVRFRFLVSPLEVVGEGGRVTGVRIERNRLVEQDDGYLRAQGTGETETLPCGMVIRSVGYRGAPVPGVPFEERRGIVPNEGGRVLVAAGSAETVPGEYVVGWAKRGPSGVIGTNKADAAGTVALMREDREGGVFAGGRGVGGGGLADLLSERAVRWVDNAGWARLDAHETACGKAQGRPRVKVCTVEEMLEAAGDPDTGV